MSRLPVVEVAFAVSAGIVALLLLSWAVGCSPSQPFGPAVAAWAGEVTP